MDAIQSTAIPTHRLPCTSEEAQHTACLNDGVCQGVPSPGGRKEIFCHCTEDWEGTRCEFVRLDPSIFLVNSSMIVGIIAAIIILLALILILVIFCIRRRRQQSLPPEIDNNRTANIDMHNADQRLLEGGEKNGTPCNMIRTTVV